MDNKARLMVESHETHMPKELIWGNSDLNLKFDVCLDCGGLLDDIEILSGGQVSGNDNDKVQSFLFILNTTANTERTFRHTLKLFKDLSDGEPN